jgi:hypothetical protein
MNTPNTFARVNGDGVWDGGEAESGMVELELFTNEATVAEGWSGSGGMAEF